MPDASCKVPPGQPPERALAPTLRAIARASGHAVSTVSCALRQEPGVAPETAERIRKIAARLGWRPNPLVSAWLAHVRQAHLPVPSLTLAYIISAREGIRSHLDSPIYRAYMEGARQRAEALGFQLEAFHYESLGGERLSRILLNRGIPALIVAPLEKPGERLDLQWEAFSCATIAYSLESPCLHRAANHHQHSVTLAIENLHQLGYQRIGLVISAEIDARSSHMFSGGFWATVKRHQITPIPPFMPSYPSFTSPNFNNWFSDHQPDAIIGNRQSLSLLQQITPDNTPGIPFADLDLQPGQSKDTGIDQKPRLIGAAAVDLATSQLFRNERGIPRDPKLILIESRWIPGPLRPNPRLRSFMSPRPNPHKPGMPAVSIR